MNIKNLFIQLFLLFFFLNSNAYSDGIFSSSNNAFLKADEAFLISLKKEENKFLIVNFNVANGYYLYKDKIKIYYDEKKISEIKFPKPIITEDEFFGISEIYKSNFSLKIKINEKVQRVQVSYQGCADKGLCYAPAKKIFEINENITVIKSTKERISDSDKIYKKLSSNNILVNIILFIGFGLLLSFTPCVLPMVPILSGIILKSNKNNSNKPFFLSLNYVLGLCTLYFLVGIFVGYSSDIYNIQSVFQDPIYLIIFSIILVLLSFSMFGFYELKISNNFQKWISNLSNKKNTGSYGGSYIMGFLSALIVGPCVAPPLAGLFIYITSESPGSFVTSLLFLSLGIGMSIPLLLYGTYMGRLVPKTGKWMKYINYMIGILLLFVALTFIDRLIPILNINDQKSSLVFKNISNVNQLKKNLYEESGKITLLDVYADWCVECKLMEQKTFRDKKVEGLLKNLNLIKIDVTDNTKEDIELLKYLNIIGPPAYKFYDLKGKEIKGFAIQGYMGPEKFFKHIEELKKY
ncbi:protein-disulfide reductase DsbD [Gammaproteobacteria bacterium]|nr:protein-disulfide reductase DsbD [Gammaproteobacteria bacterium]